MGTSKTQKKATPKFVSGWVDCSIHPFLQGIDRLPSRMKWTIISCLDSCPDVCSLVQKSQHLSKLKGGYKPLGQAIVVKTQTLLQVNRRDRIFFGSDEIWFMAQPAPRCDQNPGQELSQARAMSSPFNALASPNSGLYPFRSQIRVADPGALEDRQNAQQTALHCPFLLPPHDFSAQEKQLIQQFMQDWQISCGLGDGIGMNYRVERSEAEWMAYLLEAHERSREP